MQKEIEEADKRQDDAHIWRLIQDDIVRQFPDRKDPSEWNKAEIEHFMNLMCLTVKDRVVQNEDLARIHDLDSGNTESKAYDWAKLSYDTFKRIFKQKIYRTKRSTLDVFAVYFGYTSGEDYRLRRPKAIFEDSSALDGDVINERLSNSPSDVAKKDSPIRDGSKGSPIKTLHLVVSALVLLAVGLGIWSSPTDRATAGETDLDNLFETERPLHILVLPFARLAGTAGREVNMSGSVKEQIEWNLPTDDHTQEMMEVKVLDSQKDRYSPLEMRRIGRASGAEMVIWGSFSEQPDGESRINMYYTFVDSAFHKIAESSDRVSLAGDMGITDQMNLGRMTGTVEQVVHSCLGLVSVVQGDYDRALSYLDVVGYAQGEGPVGFYRIRGYGHYMADRDYEAAYADLKVACEMDSLHQWSLNNLGVFAMRTRRFDEAEVALEKAISIDPTYSRAIVNLGNISVMRGEFSRAIDLYDQALEIDPSDSISVVNRGEAKMELGRYDEALVDFNRFKETSPNDPYIHHYLGVLYSRMGKMDLARKSLKKALTLDPGYSDSSELLNSLDSTGDKARR